ncbi:MAG: (Fe-S)-binding protein [Planctomycetes bacterium]|nr:(Fe-S)-binding protein [Planctomycetota bacterium]
MITDRFKETIRRCAQCGTCTAGCPTSEQGVFNIRRMVRTLQLDLHEDKEFLAKIPWLCTLCERCSVLCYEGLEIPKLVKALREHALKNGVKPEKAMMLLEAIRRAENPYTSKTRTKNTWHESVPGGVRMSPNADLLYWVGCTSAMMAPNIPKAAAGTLNNLGIEFKMLDNEPCCAEPLICFGLLDEAAKIASKILQKVRQAKVKRIVTSCSGCYYTFTRTYPEVLGVKFTDIEILHTSQLVGQGIKDGSGLAKAKKPLKVTYHDPCTLGRLSGIYDDPRKVIQAIEGVTLVEMPLIRELATCCGSGGGMWTYDYKTALEICAAKINREVVPLGVDAIVTSCPSCYLNFKRSLAKLKSSIKIYDLTELGGL